MVQFIRFILLVAAVATARAATSGSSSDDSTSVPNSRSANILFIAPVGAKSHKNFFYSVIEVLSMAGHKVTMLTPYPPSRKIDNVREIVLASSDMPSKLPSSLTTGSQIPLATFNMAIDNCIDALQSEVVVSALQDKYDLVFLSSLLTDCFLPHVNAMKVPFVYIHTFEMFGGFTSFRIGNPYFPSYDITSLITFKNPKTFLQRAIAVVSDIGMNAIYYYCMYRMEYKGRSLGLFPTNAPHLLDIATNTSLMIVNGYRLAEHPRPYMPNILMVGGLHLKPPKPLPTELENWVASSGEAGFIFFSLGSVVRSSDLPEETARLLVSVFKSLSQKVLWKYDLEDLPGGLPPNVRLTKWAPQQDLLGDPRVRLFISHGGLLSTMEATYHGVPVLGLPVYADQYRNMKKAEEEGWGKRLDLNELTFDLLRDSIIEFIEDPNKRARVQQVGRLMRDQPTNPADDIAWWTGYLLRTGGAPHLRSGAADLSWYHLYNTDVWLVLVFCALLMLTAVVWLLRYGYRRWCGYKTSAQKAIKQKRS